MTEQETYDKFFADEEYDLEKCTVVAYSYWSGWNSALKRASRIVRDEVRPHGEWEEGTQGHYCSVCYEIDYSYYDHNFCPNCGAEMKGGKEE